MNTSEPRRVSKLLAIWKYSTVWRWLWRWWQKYFMIFHMNQGKKRRSGPLELIIQPRVSSLMVTNQLLHRVYKYKCKSIQIHTWIKYKYKCILMENMIKQKMSLTSLIVRDHILHQVHWWWYITCNDRIRVTLEIHKTKRMTSKFLRFWGKYS